MKEAGRKSELVSLKYVQVHIKAIQWGFGVSCKDSDLIHIALYIYKQMPSNFF